MSTNVNRGLAWIGVASSLVGVLDLLAILVILNFWISAEEYGIATKCIWIFPILDQATDLGLSAAVIQRDDHSDAEDLDGVLDQPRHRRGAVRGCSCSSRRSSRPSTATRSSAGC